VTITSDELAIYPLGTTTVSFAATDDSGNSSTGSMTVTVVDTTPPTLVAPPDVEVEETDPLGTLVVLGAPTVSDACDPAPTVTYAPQPAVFGLGTWQVTWTSIDASGNSSTAVQDVTVIPGPAENQLGNLADLIGYEVANGAIDLEYEQSLTAKVDAAIDALARGNSNDAKVAMNALKAFINEVNAQSGKRIDTDVAAAVIERADRIIVALGG